MADDLDAAVRLLEEALFDAVRVKRGERTYITLKPGP